MPWYQKTLQLPAKTRGFHLVTDLLTAAVPEMRKISRGLLHAFIQHTSASLMINENADPDVPRDMLHALRTLIPQHGMGFRHGEENSDAHIKTSLVGTSVTVPFSDGELLLGRWQGIFLCEFDGGRERQVIMFVK